MMKLSLATAVGTSVAAAIAVILTAPATAGSIAHTTMPTHAAVFDIGSKHAVSYFTRDDGACNVTLMIGDKADSDGNNASVGTKMTFVVDAKRTARTDTSDGQSLEFTCAKDAATMAVRPIARLAYARDAK